MEICDLVDSVANLSRRCVLHDALGNSTDTPTADGSAGEVEALQHLLVGSSSYLIFIPFLSFPYLFQSLSK